MQDSIPVTKVSPSRETPNVFDDVRSGLLEPPRSMPPKYLYNAVGSKLFEQICTVSEYYPTRTEGKLLDQNSALILEATQPEQILEFGSGNCQKTRHLLDACEKLDFCCSYAPFEYCDKTLQATAEKLKQEYNWLNLTPLHGDYHAGLDDLPIAEGQRLFLFIGGTIGNFSQDEALKFLREVRSHMRPGDSLLLGMDRVKDEKIIEAAYNDKQGITAKFNLNMLNVLNQKLEANFDLSNFSHQAMFNNQLSRIEMRLVSLRDHTVQLKAINETIKMPHGDSILTEVSHKFSIQAIEQLMENCGLHIQHHFEANKKYYSLVLARAFD